MIKEITTYNIKINHKIIFICCPIITYSLYYISSCYVSRQLIEQHKICV